MPAKAVNWMRRMAWFAAVLAAAYVLACLYFQWRHPRAVLGAESKTMWEPHWPAGFLWGTATAAHQVEGGNTYNDWARFERLPGKIAHGSRAARRRGTGTRSPRTSSG